MAMSAMVHPTPIDEEETAAVRFHFADSPASDEARPDVRLEVRPDASIPTSPYRMPLSVRSRERPPSSTHRQVTYHQAVQEAGIELSQRSVSLLSLQTKHALAAKVSNTLPTTDEGHPNEGRPTGHTNAADAKSIQSEMHVQEVSSLLRNLRTSEKSGLSHSDVLQSRLEHGSNRVTLRQRGVLDFLWLFTKELFSGFGLILWIAGLLAIFAWKPIGEANGGVPDPLNLGLGIVIFIVVLLQAIFNVVQIWQSSSILQSFQAFVPSMCVVRRAGGRQEVPSEELVVGDIIELTLGLKVPADIRLLTNDGLHLNNAALTGESEPVRASTVSTSAIYLESANIAFFGALVVEGSATGVVLNVGDSTVLGKITELTTRSNSSATTLQIEISRFVKIIVLLALINAGIIWIGWAAWLRVDYPTFMPAVTTLINCIGVVVAYIPEGLPIAVTLTLSIIARRMLRHHVLVKNLASVETFNSVSIICTDKTGTLTQARMQVKHLGWGVGQSCTHGEVMLHMVDKEGDAGFAMLLDGLLMCNAAKEVTVQTSQESSLDTAPPSSSPHSNVAPVASHVIQVVPPQRKVVGDAADLCIREFLIDALKIPMSERQAAAKEVCFVPFNSKRKMMLSVRCVEQRSTDAPAPGETEATHALWVKGAPELLLARCTHVLGDGGVRVELTAGHRAHLLRSVETLASQGCRVLALANRPLHWTPQLADDASSVDAALAGGELALAQGLTWLGHIGLADPPRPEVGSSIMKARRAGIAITMVTGDHPLTAAAIAQEVGIFSRSLHRDTLELRTDELGRTHVIIMRMGVAIASRCSSLPARSLPAGKLTNMSSELSLSHHYLPLSANPYSTLQARSTEAALLQGDGERADIHFDLVQQPAARRAMDAVANGLTPVPCWTSADSVSSPDTLPFGLVVTGAVMLHLDSVLWQWVLKHAEIVFARTSPEQKLLLVKEYQKRGHICAVTGDGVNDAPALKQAELGVAMAAGSDVAKEAGDLVLLDNNFGSVITAVQMGRTVFDNLKKVTLYLLPAGSWSEMMPVMVNVFLGVPLALSTFLMIIICVVTDVFPSLALVNERAEANVMLRKPRRVGEDHLVNWRLILHAYLLIGMFETFAAFFVYFLYLDSKGVAPGDAFLAFDKWTDGYLGKTQDELNEIQFTGQSIFFVSLVITQFGNLLATRTRYTSIFASNPFWGPSRNYHIPVAVVLSTLAAIIVTQVPFFNNQFNTRPVPFVFILPSIGFAIALIVVDEIRKKIVRDRPDSVLAKLAW